MVDGEARTQNPGLSFGEYTSSNVDPGSRRKDLGYPGSMTQDPRSSIEYDAARIEGP